MTEMARAGEYHRDAEFITGINRFLIANGAAGLDDCGDPGIVRDVALQMLGTLGFDGEAFADGAAAAEAFAAARAAGRGFAAAVLDLTVPAGLGAEETALRLKAIDPDARLVVTSGYATAPPMVDPVAHGFAAAIVKPYTPAELADVLERALSAAV